MFVKSWVIKDRVTRRPIYSDGRRLYSVGRSKKCGIPVHPNANSTSDIIQYAAKVATRLGREVYIEDAEEVEVFNVY